MKENKYIEKQVFTEEPKVELFTPNFMKKWMRANVTFPQSGVLIFSAALDSVIEDNNPETLQGLIDVMQHAPNRIPDEVVDVALERMHKAHAAMGIALAREGKAQELADRIGISVESVSTRNEEDFRDRFDPFVDICSLLDRFKREGFTLEEISKMAKQIQDVCYKDENIKVALQDYRERHRALHSAQNKGTVKQEIELAGKTILRQIEEKISENYPDLDREKIEIFIDRLE